MLGHPYLNFYLLRLVSVVSCVLFDLLQGAIFRKMMCRSLRPPRHEGRAGGGNL